MKKIVSVFSFFFTIYLSYGQYCTDPEMITIQQLDVQECSKGKNFLITYDIEYCIHKGAHQSKLILKSLYQMDKFVGILSFIKNGEFIQTEQSKKEIDEIVYSNNGVRIDTSIRNVKKSKLVVFETWTAYYRIPCILTDKNPILQMKEICRDTSNFSTIDKVEKWSEWFNLTFKGGILSYRYLEENQDVKIEIKLVATNGEYILNGRILGVQNGIDFSIRNNMPFVTTINNKKMKDLEIIIIDYHINKNRMAAGGVKG